MNWDDQRIAALAASFENREESSKNLLAFQDVIRSGLGIKFFKMAMDYFNANSPSNEAAVTNFMSSLEGLAQKNTSLAIYLMTKLWKPAGSMYMHDICDAIDLWIENERSAESDKLIKISSTEDENSDMGWKYSDWLSR